MCMYLLGSLLTHDLSISVTTYLNFTCLLWHVLEDSFLEMSRLGFIMADVSSVKQQLGIFFKPNKTFCFIEALLLFMQKCFCLHPIWEIDRCID